MKREVFLIALLSLLFLAGCQSYLNQRVRGVDADADGDGRNELAVVYPFGGGFFSASSSALGSYVLVFEPEISVGEPSWKGVFGNVQNTAAHTSVLNEHPLPYSAIENPERDSDQILLDFKVQRFVDGQWMDVEIFVKPTSNYFISSSQFVLFDGFMQEKFIPQEPGEYRFSVHVRNPKGYEMVHPKYGVLEKSYEFIVKDKE